MKENTEYALVIIIPGNKPAMLQTIRIKTIITKISFFIDLLIWMN